MMSEQRLTGWEHRTLRTALQAAFTASELRLLVYERLDVQLDNVINTDAPFDTLTFDLVGWADRQGQLLSLFDAASAENPGNGTLKRAVAEVFHVEQRDAQLQAMVAATGFAGGGFVDPAKWRDEFARTELGLCRIENGEGQPWGTGWLVANDLVVTNRHVWTAVLKQGRTVSTARAAFNYRVLPTGGLAFANRVGFSTMNPLVTESAVEELDFALLRLDHAIGGTPAASYAGAPLINPLRPRAYEFKGGEPAIILQHPDGEPLKLAWGSISDAAQQVLPHRVVHGVNTLPGSSGSPVFLSDWQPVALHAQGHTEKTNAGVAMSEVLPLISQYIA